MKQAAIAVMAFGTATMLPLFGSTGASTRPGSPETVILEDGFDGYTVGQPPPTRDAYETPLWWHTDASTVLVIDRDAVSRPHALELTGDRAMAWRPFDRQRRKELLLTLDFKIVENKPGSYYQINLCGPGPSDTWADAALRLLVWQGRFMVPDREAQGGNRVLEPVMLNVWYHLEARLAPVASEINRYDLTLRREGKTTVFKRLPFALPAPELAAIASLNVGVEKGCLRLDNVRLVSRRPAVPRGDNQ